MDCGLRAVDCLRERCVWWLWLYNSCTLHIALRTIAPRT
jgi:hypothetical protein